jgi:hypothetical protein
MSNDVLTFGMFLGPSFSCYYDTTAKIVSSRYNECFERLYKHVVYNDHYIACVFLSSSYSTIPKNLNQRLIATPQ